MTDMKSLSANALSAAMRGGMETWGQQSNAFEHVRYCEPVSSLSRRRCPCCRKRATHRGMANGIALVAGCEFRMRRWVKSPLSIYGRDT